MLLDGLSFRQDRIVAIMLVFFFNPEQIQFNVSLRTEKDGFCSIIPIAYSMLLKKTGDFYKGSHDID